MKRITGRRCWLGWVVVLMMVLPVSAYDMAPAEGGTRLSAGLSHDAYVDRDGVLWTWGSNNIGVLREERRGMDFLKSAFPRPLRVMEQVLSVSVGSNFTVALKTDGTLWTWGANNMGQLGTGEIVSSPTPVQVLDEVTAVSAGDYHVAAIRTDGTLWAWGNNLYGQLGDGTLENRPVPEKILENVASVSAGAGTTGAILRDGSLWTWGDNLFGQLGDGSQTNRSLPGKVLDEVTAVSMGGYHTAAIRGDGQLWIWGGNAAGELGNGGMGNVTDQSGVKMQTTPVNVELPSPVTAVSTGTGTTAVLLADGTLWTWGRNESGQLGHTQEAASVSRPAQVADVTRIAAIGTGTYQTLCVQENGTLLSWGKPILGQVRGGKTGPAPSETVETEGKTGPVWEPWGILLGAVFLMLLFGIGLCRKQREQ